MSPVLRGAMSENVQRAVLDILKTIQGEMASFRSETTQRFERLETSSASSTATLPACR
jgi:hypothetical protein